MNALTPIAIVLIVIVFVVVLMNWIMWRKGYRIPGNTAVKCSRGHLFRTTWVEGGSLVSIRLSPTRRFHYCPVGKHWAIIHPVKEQDLTGDERKKLSE